MDIKDVDFCVTDWTMMAQTTHNGESGQAFWRTLEVGNVRARIVEYSAGYVADHWCSRGHVLYVLEGELVTELKDGRIFTLRPGMSYQVGTGSEPHRSRTQTGARLFVVD